MALKADELAAWDDPAERVREGWRGDVGIPELLLIIRYVKRPRGMQALAADLMKMGWGTEHAGELALITSRLCELVYTRVANRG